MVISLHKSLKIRAYRVIVCGGRKYLDEGSVFITLDCLPYPEMVLLMHGAAPGADTLAQNWAEARGVRVHPYPAAWGRLDYPDAVIRTLPSGRTYDANAGRRRNGTMLKAMPDVVIAFPGGPGTEHMVGISRAAGIPVFEFKPKDGLENIKRLQTMFDPWGSVGSRISC